MAALWDQHSTAALAPPCPYLSDGYFSGKRPYRTCNHCEYATAPAQTAQVGNLEIVAHLRKAHGIT